MLLKFLESVPQFRQVVDALGRSFAMPVFAAGVSGAERALLAFGISEKYGKPVLIITPDEASATRLSEDIAQLCPQCDADKQNSTFPNLLNIRLHSAQRNAQNTPGH